MAELIIISVVLLLGGAAYWLFGDPDRSQRLSLMIRPKTFFVPTLVFVGQAVRFLQKGDILWSAISLICVGVLIWNYRKERRNLRPVVKFERKISDGDLSYKSGLDRSQAQGRHRSS